MMKTLTIAGHKITLEPGTRYIASRPFNQRGRTEYPITIRRLVDDGDRVPGTLERAEPDLVIYGLSYERANELLGAFNNGVSSFSGRIW